MRPRCDASRRRARHLEPYTARDDFRCTVELTSHPSLLSLGELGCSLDAVAARDLPDLMPQQTLQTERIILVPLAR